MHLSRPFLLVLAAAALPASAQDARFRDSPPRGAPGAARGPSLPAPLPPLLGDCDAAALAMKSAAEREATADYWRKIAACLNDAGCEFTAFEPVARAELERALLDAETQFQARLAVCAELGQGPYDPVLDPSEFSPVVDNPLLPFPPRRTLIYEKRTDQGLETVEVTAGKEVVDVAGFPCRAVRVVEKLDGVKVEETLDWYSQRTDGAVWYFGELAKHYVDGFLDNLDGSWRTGRDGAKPGIVMLADPRPGDVYRQEFSISSAEDLARVLATGETVTVPYGTFTNCVKIEEWSPLSPENAEWKYYSPTFGMVLEVDSVTGERLELVRVRW